MPDSAEPMRLLVVADHAPSRRAVCEQLECRGFVVSTADVKPEVVAALRAGAIELIIADLDAKCWPAIEPALAARSSSGAQLLAITARDDRATALAARALGALEVLVRPLHGNQIEQAVERARRMRQLAGELEEHRSRLERVLRLGRLGSFEIDWKRRRIHCSAEARRILGFTDAAESIPLDDLTTLVATPSREAWLTWLDRVAAGTTERPVELRLFRPDQTERVVRVQAEKAPEKNGPSAAASADDDDSIRLLAIVHDITDRRRVEEELEYQALHDDLTGLANRRQIVDDLEQALVRARETRTRVAVLFFDLDRFKDVNESLGREIGDRLLVTFAERLESGLRQSDLIARVDPSRERPNLIARPGGDEFTAMIEGLLERQDAANIAERMLQATARPFVIEGHEVFLTTCVGIAVGPDDGTSALELLKSAETAMYHAKERGRSSFAYFEPAMNRLAEHRLALESALRRGIERGELEVWYQPRIELATSRIVGMEALVRWRHPELGLVMPAQFIPVAEESGLILPLGTFVLREACAQTRRWQDAGFSGLRIAVNLSAEQFRDAALPDVIERTLADHRLPADSLELELTESILMRDVETALKILARLHAKGIHLSVDDFGTGYSSLAYLKRFPIDCLKIDRSFVRDVTSNAGDAAITSSIVVMAHSLSLEVVAEGVETIDQLDFLRRQRCDQVQGFYFSRPLPAAEATALLERQVVEPLHA